jgi:hypothetical protein
MTQPEIESMVYLSDEAEIKLIDEMKTTSRMAAKGKHQNNSQCRP